MQIKLAALGAGILLASVASAALAAGQPEAVERVEERVVVMSHGPGGMDADKDGVVSRAEFDAMHDRMWSKMDADGDGKIAADEMGNGPGGHMMMMDHGPGHAAMGEHGPGHGAMAGHGAGHGARHDIHIVRHGGEGLDANKDGKLSLDEFTAPMRDHFKEADKNRNGFLDKDEMGGDGERVVIRRTEKRED